MPRLLRLVVIIVAIVIIGGVTVWRFWLATRRDVVVQGASPGEEVGLLLIAGATPYTAVTGDAPVVPVGAIAQGTGRNEVLAFSAGHGPGVRQPAPWGAGPVLVRLGERVPLKLHHWILVPPDPRRFGGIMVDFNRVRALIAGYRAESIWRAEGVPATMVSQRIDAGDGGDFLDFCCGDAAVNRDALLAAFPVAPDEVAIYWVARVCDAGGEMREDWGRSCGFGQEQPFVAIGIGAEPALLAHELGHNFDLQEHWEEVSAGLASTSVAAEACAGCNVMASLSTEREFFTEGQVVRMFLRETSPLRPRSGELVATGCNDPFSDCVDCRQCFQIEGSASCPAITAHVWANEP